MLPWLNFVLNNLVFVMLWFPRAREPQQCSDFWTAKAPRSSLQLLGWTQRAVKDFAGCLGVPFMTFDDYHKSLKAGPRDN